MIEPGEAVPLLIQPQRGRTMTWDRNGQFHGVFVQSDLAFK